MSVQVWKLVVGYDYCSLVSIESFHCNLEGQLSWRCGFI